uniref:Translin-associated factor X-like protein n=1 Tax=Borely moumouvirus TaxID=2712067 RepID=A0A6G6AC65_9VIRU
MSRKWLYPIMDKQSYLHLMETGELDDAILKYINRSTDPKKFLKNKYVSINDHSQRKKGHCYCGSKTVHVLTKDGWATVCNKTLQNLKQCKN